MAKLDAEYVLAVMREQNTDPVRVCVQMGIETRTMGRWLTGETAPREVTLRALARVLKVNKEDLLAEEEE